MFYNFMVEKLNFRMFWSSSSCSMVKIFCSFRHLGKYVSIWDEMLAECWHLMRRRVFILGQLALLQQQSQIIHGSPLGPTSKPKDAHKALFHYLLPFQLKNNPFLKTKTEGSWKLSFWTKIQHFSQCVTMKTFLWHKSKVNFVKPKENLSLLFCCHPNCPGIEFWVSRVIRADTYHAFQAPANVRYNTTTLCHCF